MIQLNIDGTLVLEGPAEQSSGRTKATIELPVDLLDQQDDLIDRIFSFAFDALDLQTVELRIHPSVWENQERHSNSRIWATSR